MLTLKKKKKKKAEIQYRLTTYKRKCLEVISFNDSTNYFVADC